MNIVSDLGQLNAPQYPDIHFERLVARPGVDKPPLFPGEAQANPRKHRYSPDSTSIRHERHLAMDPLIRCQSSGPLQDTNVLIKMSITGTRFIDSAAFFTFRSANWASEISVGLTDKSSTADLGMELNSRHAIRYKTCINALTVQ